MDVWARGCRRRVWVPTPVSPGSEEDGCVAGQACGKRRYRDEAASDLALARIRDAGDVREKTPQRAYRCPRCRGWHLTSWPATLPGPPGVG